MTLNVLDLLKTWPGVWEGQGINHEQQQFKSVLVARPLFKGGATVFWFSARGLAGELYHEELGILGGSMAGATCMTSANTSVPFLQSFDSAGSDKSAAFLQLLHGDHSSDGGFRETLTFEAEKPEVIRVSFLWGMPGEPVAERSAVSLTQSKSPVPESCPLK